MDELPKGQSSSDQAEMGLFDHLTELRQRFLRIIIAAFIGMLACYAFAEILFNWLMLPLIQAMPDKSTMIYTAPHEAFFTYIKVALVGGIFLTSPYIFYQLWLFVRPGLYAHEKKYILPISFFSALLFVGGAIFGYSIIFPYAYKFFMGFAKVYISPMITLREGFSFALRLLIAFGIVFELPLVIFFLARLGLVTPKSLRKKRKYAILGTFLLSALITPPDLVTQVFMAGPLIFLYEVGIWIAVIFGKKKPKSEEKAKESSPLTEER